MHWLFISLLLLLPSCAWHPCTEAYHSQYAYLKTNLSHCVDMQETDYFLVILVEARHLDYSNNRSLIKTLVKHPSDGSKNGDVGHAWIYLRGLDNERIVSIEGGHSGELGLSQAKYFDGIMNYIDFGYSNPTPKQLCNPRFEENPVRYLSDIQHDGFFEVGSGGHRPTFAAKIDLTKEQFYQIRELIRPGLYPYETYSLSDNQCCTLVRKAALLAGFELQTKVTIQIEPELVVGKDKIRLWTDPNFAFFCFESPDILESSLIRIVNQGEAEYALAWYKKNHPITAKQMIKKGINDFKCLPGRIERLIYY